MGHIADSLPHPGDWTGEKPLYSAAEAAVFLGVKPLTITNRVYRRTLTPAAWSKDTGGTASPAPPSTTRSTRQKKPAAKSASTGTSSPTKNSSPRRA